ncbi:hypothetical protein M1307_02375 [Patescibacteria group bacterium]|nr:hypothetical protein [Patescibacteria group bacterium]
MAVEIGPNFMQTAVISGEITKGAPASSPDLDAKKERGEIINWSALLKRAQQKTFSLTPIIHFENRPLEPIEPTPNSLSDENWNKYVKQRDDARAYAIENDLRGTF